MLLRRSLNAWKSFSMFDGRPALLGEKLWAMQAASSSDLSAAMAAGSTLLGAASVASTASSRVSSSARRVLAACPLLVGGVHASMAARKSAPEPSASLPSTTASRSNSAIKRGSPVAATAAFSSSASETSVRALI